MVALIVILVVMVAFSGIFIPTRTAVIPQLTSLHQLGAANALSAGTWSVMLAFGAALGGVVTGLVGIEMSLVIDALTFLASAALLLPLPPLLPHEDSAAEVAAGGSDRSFAEGLRYLRRHPYLAVLISLKPCMALGGGALAMLPVFATRVFEATAGPTYIGLLYASRGLGALVGSLLVRRVFGDAPATMRRFIIPAFLVISASYFALSEAQHIGHAALAYFGSAVGGGTLWTFSGTLSQRESDNAYRGRVFSVEWGALTLTMSAAAGAAGVLVDRLGWSVQLIARVSGALLLLPAALWLLAQRLHRNPHRGAPHGGAQDRGDQHGGAEREGTER
jgi:predicted MFS family arabinose efflux permease